MKLVVFDIDGTLVDTAAESDAAFLEALRDVIADPVSPDWADYEDATDSGIADAALRSHLGRTPEAAEVQALKCRYLQRLKQRLIVGRQIEGAASFLGKMQGSKDWAVAVATGNWRTAAVYKLEVSGLAHEGIPMATADDAVRRSDILRKAINLAGSVNRVVYVGDRDWDIRAADDVGVGFVAIGNLVRLAKARFSDFCDPAGLKAALEAAAR